MSDTIKPMLCLFVFVNVKDTFLHSHERTNERTKQRKKESAIEAKKSCCLIIVVVVVRISW